MVPIDPRAAKAAATFLALYAAHQVGDHWVQSSEQACDKSLPGARGWSANLAHVAGYTATAVIAVAAVNRTCGLRLSVRHVAAALAFSAATHAWADRRHTLRWLADTFGKGKFYRAGAEAPCGSGAYALDQSFHHAMLAIAAVIAAQGAPRVSTR